MNLNLGKAFRQWVHSIKCGKYLNSYHWHINPCLVAEPDKVLVGGLNDWVANPLGPGQTSALQIKTRSA